MTSCSICCENLNKSSRLPVDCKGCETDENVCRTCAQTFIINTNDDPKCMMCKSTWDRQFIQDALTKTFVETKLKSHMENVMVERQIALLPETQIYASREKQKRAIDERIAEVNSVINRYKAKIESQKILSTS